LTHPNSGFLGRLRTTRIIDRAIKNEWQNDCGAVSMPKDSVQTRVAAFDTANHFIILTEILFV